jgi:hypothetical protein
MVSNVAGTRTDAQPTKLRPVPAVCRPPEAPRLRTRTARMIITFAASISHRNPEHPGTSRDINEGQ